MFTHARKASVHSTRSSAAQVVHHTDESARTPQSASNPTGETVQRQQNDTGMPDQLKSGIESLSGQSMDDVKVHYNSDKPAGLQAHAYAQGSNIHLGPGQEKHLPHEAWHVVQQKQGRVSPTTQMKGLNVNDNAGLEKEATTMGDKAMNVSSEGQVEMGSTGGGEPVAQLAKGKSGGNRDPWEGGNPNHGKGGPTGRIKPDGKHHTSKGNKSLSKAERDARRARERRQFGEGGGGRWAE